MPRVWIAIGLIAGLIGGGAATQPGAPSLVTLTAAGLILEWRTPPAQFVLQPDGALRIDLPGFAPTAQPGAPRLPFASALIALPPDADPRLRILNLEETQQPLPGRLDSAPQPDGVVRDATNDPIGGAYSPSPATIAVRHDPIEIEELGVMRGVRLARVTFYPIRAESDHLRVASFVRVAIDFNAEARPQPAAGDALLNAVRAAVINPDQVTPAPRAPAAIRSADPPRFAVEVRSTGLTALTYDALAASGFPIDSIDPHNLHLRRAGNEIAAEWAGDDDALFEPGERLLFFAEPRFSRYTAADMYFLSSEATPGLRMSTRSGRPGSLPAGDAWVAALAETNALYTPECYCGRLPAGRDGDRWTWDDVRRPDRANPSYTIRLPSLDETKPATLTAWFIGYTDVQAGLDHRVDVLLNGAPLGRVEWNGKLAATATLPISPGVLRSQSNTVTLSLPGLAGVNVEGMWLDAFAIRYARGATPDGGSAIFTGAVTRSAYTLALTSTLGLRAYDVTDADNPQRLTNFALAGHNVTLGDPSGGLPRRYALAAESDLLAPVRIRAASPLLTDGVGGADYLIIAPAELIPALADLVALRQSQGMTVAVENVQSIYDAYDGRPEPDAIRAYLAGIYNAWTPRPAYVLLVGDGTFDPKRQLSGTPPTLIPPYLADVDPWAGETAADNRFVTVDGADTLPDMSIGRLPVNTLAETQIVVGKIVRYETQPAAGRWNARLLFAADNADSAGNFPAYSDFLATTLIDKPFSVTPAYYIPPDTTPLAVQETIWNQWNGGAGLVMFNGHASISQWAAERLFHRTDIPGLLNGARLPVVLEMTCFTGSFHFPSYPTLDEWLVRAPNGGAVAAWGPTGLGVATGHAFLAEGFLRSAYRFGVRDLGSATLSGKLSLATHAPYALDLIDTFTLLGDPATPLNLNLQPEEIYLPVVHH